MPQPPPTYWKSTIATCVSAALLRGWKQKGLSRGRAREALAQLRAESLTDPEDDALLELLDVVEGWCRPELLVWLDGEG